MSFVEVPHFEIVASEIQFIMLYAFWAGFGCIYNGVKQKFLDSQVVSTVLLNLLPEDAKLLNMQGKAKIAGKVSPAERSCSLYC